MSIPMYRHVERLQEMKSSIENSKKLNHKMFDDILNIAEKFEYNLQVYELVIILVIKLIFKILLKNKYKFMGFFLSIAEFVKRIGEERFENRNL